MTGGDGSDDATEHGGFLGGIGWFLRSVGKRPVLKGVEVDAENREVVGMGLLKLDERGHFLGTGRAPRGPKVEEDRAASEFGKAMGASFQIEQFEIREWVAGWGRCGRWPGDGRGVVLTIPPLAPKTLSLGKALLGLCADLRRKDAAMSRQGVREAKAGIEPAPPTQDGIGGEGDARFGIRKAIQQCRGPAGVSNATESLEAESAYFRIGIHDLRSQDRKKIVQGRGGEQPKRLFAQAQVCVLRGFAENLSS